MAIGAIGSMVLGLSVFGYKIGGGRQEEGRRKVGGGTLLRKFLQRFLFTLMSNGPKNDEMPSTCGRGARLERRLCCSGGSGRSVPYF